MALAKLATYLPQHLLAELAAPGSELTPGEKAVVNLLVERADLPMLAAAADVHVGRVPSDEPASGP